MKNESNTPLYLAFAITGILFLLFLGGAITLTMSGQGMHRGLESDQLLSGISWLWIPTALSLILSLLLGWTIYAKRESKQADS